MVDQRGALRTFIALPLPAEWIALLEDVIYELDSAASGGVRWVRPSGIHLTLKFLGATDPALAPRILDGLLESLDGALAPALSLSGLGTFPNRNNPRVIWAGVSGDIENLADLQQRVETLAVGLGWAAERRPFRPHLTIGRVRDRIPTPVRRRLVAAISNCAVPRLASWRPDAVRLYKSELTPRGAIYTNLGEVEI